jgi:hypothetical protein
MGESMKEGGIECVDSPKKVVCQIFEKSPWEHYISKSSFNFRNKFLYF